MMKGKKLIFLFCILLLLFFKVFSLPSTCDNPISIECNQTLSNLCVENDYEYFNYTLFTNTNVKIELVTWLGSYNITAFYDPEVCPYGLNNNTDPGPFPGPIYLNGLEGSAEGNTYFILVGGMDNDCSDPFNYFDLTLECGEWCGNGLLETDKGEECDYANWVNGTARCKPYEICGFNCRCYDLRQDATGCDFYDYCKDGMNVTDPTLPCCVNATGDPTYCCIDSSGNPVLNCSQVNYRRNPIANASSEYCFVSGYDITDVCIDNPAFNHALRINCTSPSP